MVDRCFVIAGIGIGVIGDAAGVFDRGLSLKTLKSRVANLSSLLRLKDDQ
jgi:hypothetical protein